MSVLVWDDKLATGLPEVDQEHRWLIEWINYLASQRVRGASEDDLCAVLGALRDYTLYHFHNEEELMRLYPVSDAHRELHFKAHQGFIDRLATANKLVRSNPHYVIDHLLVFLVKWLVSHISGIDVRLGKEIIALRANAASGQVTAQETVLEESWVHTVSELYDTLGQRTLEMMELNGQLQQELDQRRRSEDALRLATLVYEHASEAMVVTDADNCILAVNSAFSAITGFTPDEVLGQNPKMLRSGRHDKAFYAEMWRSLNTTGRWTGEIWNRRKDGREYAEWLSINTIRNADQSIYRYVALFSDVTEKKLSDEIILNQANYDSLTQLPNRRLFHDRLEQEIKKASRSGLYLALLFIDLDSFKEVNDTIGHQMGDLLLVEAARRIVDCVRASDTVARLGGDEFTVILTDIADTNQIERVAQAIIQTLNEPFQLKHEMAYISASIGVTVYPCDATDAQTLLINADQSMYVAKNAGRNRFSYFTEALHVKAMARQQMLRDMRDALVHKQFCVYFQPIVDLASGHIFKAEALIRWKHPERGIIGPSEFIPLAEESGLINPIGKFVFKESVRWAKRWADLSPAGFQVSVNKSPVQLHSAVDEHDTWLNHMLDCDLSNSSIVIEITEGLLLEAEASTTDKLLKYRQAGVQVAIDDFGTGYSAFSSLKKIDFDYLKIDQSFVRDMTTGSNDLALSEAIIVMAHKLGLKVIAEGVETEEQQNLLAAAGCDYVQGFFYSRAVPPEAFEELLRNNWASLGVSIRDTAKIQ
jgi:diguanylate cyclase (GGDEF)-like protein/hemerythrin-like metal-binding protein/PAS domain S-box-containing protein